jgi:glycogen operon protein
MLNSSCQDKTVKIPSAIGGKKWYRVVDTSLPSPEDFLPAGEEEMLNRSVYVLPARSFAVLLSK